MKSIIIRIVLVFALSALFLSIGLFATSCSAIVEQALDEVFDEYPYLEEPLDKVWRATSSFQLQENDDVYMKSPHEFEHDGGGNYQDFCAWMIYHLGRESSIAAIYTADGILDHPVVEYKGEFIDPVIYGKKYELGDTYITWTMSYKTVMDLSTAMYTK